MGNRNSDSELDVRGRVLYASSIAALFHAYFRLFHCDLVTYSGRSDGQKLTEKLPTKSLTNILVIPIV